MTMVISKAKTVEKYLRELPDDRREIISTVRNFILEHLPEGYAESMNWGMISYEIPLEHYPDTYNGKPLSYMALAAQKNYNALYMICVYQDEELLAYLQNAYRESGKQLDMGKSCLRFRQVVDLHIKALAKIISSTPLGRLTSRHMSRPVATKCLVPIKLNL